MTDTTTGQPSNSHSFGKDPLGSVSQLIDDGGKAAATYGYKPSGDADSALSARDTNPKDPINPVRFTEKRYDSGSGTIDMGGRRFGPSNRFLQEDRYANALSDLDLATDPLTSNRYSLAGGNPANFVEVDGHFSIRKAWGDAKKFVKKHKVTIAATAAGIGCGLITAGAAAAGCAAGVAAVAGAYEAKTQCKGQGVGCAAKKIGTSVAMTAAGGSPAGSRRLVLDALSAESSRAGQASPEAGRLQRQHPVGGAPKLPLVACVIWRMRFEPRASTLLL